MNYDRLASRKIPRRGATLIEFGCCFTMIVAGWIGLTLGLRWYGWWGGIAGCLLLPLALQCLGWLIIFVNSWIFGCIPNLPACPNGCCSRKDYEPGPNVPSLDWYWQCKCGIHYRKLGPGSRRLMIVNPDNSHTPYMRYIPCLGWRKDNGPGTGPCW